MTKDCRLNVILDLDSTIIYAADLKEKEKIPVSLPLHYKDFVPMFRIYERPHLQEFLDYIFEHFNVAVFTAASKDYCLFIVKNFILIDRPNKPMRNLEFIFYDYQLDESHDKYGGVKDLRIIFDMYKIKNFHMCNTVIIDDYDEVAKTNPYNCLPIKRFEVIKEDDGTFDKEAVNDTGLLHILEKLKYIEGQLHMSKNCLYGFMTRNHKKELPLLKSISMN